MAATYRHLYGHDAKAIAEARREKNRERLARRVAKAEANGKPPPQRLWVGETPKDWANVGDGDAPLHTVIEEKRDAEKREAKAEAKVEDPMKHLRQGGRIPVEVLVYLGDEPLRLQFSTNMRGTLPATHLNEAALKEVMGRVFKGAFG